MNHNDRVEEHAHDTARPRKWWQVWRRREAVLITDAKRSPGQDRRRREVVYSALMFLRVPSLMLSFYLIYAHSAWLAAAVISAITVPLPWVAVVIANTKGEKKSKKERAVYKPALVRQARERAQAEALHAQAAQAQALHAAGVPGSAPGGAAGGAAGGQPDSGAAGGAAGDNSGEYSGETIDHDDN